MFKKLTYLFLAVSLFNCTGQIDNKNEKSDEKVKTEREKSDTFVIKNEPLDNLSTNKIENLDSKYGFKNIRLETEFNQFNFGSDWVIYDYKDKLIIATQNLTTLKVSDTKLSSIKLFFFEKNLFEIQVIADSSDGKLWEPLIYLYGQPNRHQFGDVKPKYNYTSSFRNFSNETFKPTVYEYTNDKTSKRSLKKDEKIKVQRNNKPSTLYNLEVKMDQEKLREWKYEMRQQKDMAIWSTNRTQLIYIDAYLFEELRISTDNSKKLWAKIEKLALQEKSDENQKSLEKQIQDF